MEEMKYSRFSPVSIEWYFNIKGQQDRSDHLREIQEHSAQDGGGGANVQPPESLYFEDHQDQL